MADPHRHPSPQSHPAQQTPQAPGAIPADAPGISEAGAWWRQLRASRALRVLGALLLATLLVAALLVWHAHA
ncbi:hypothetical protein [Xanthomonas sp. 1678]|uniref:hypothetical protein n=1 Tax=Xanthomonas sp. 1678 TaxID=3158788 RepID=UPI0028671498|nr:hypothetical protein [Xanthomonas translucens]